MIRISDNLSARLDGDDYVFENNRGLMVNGNRRIHMKNWEIEDLSDIVTFLLKHPKCDCAATKTDGSEHWSHCRYA